jgi:hypothetical protein
LAKDKIVGQDAFHNKYYSMRGKLGAI